ncbi:MAG: cell wall-active antibiotics response protein [Acidimicrobiia bacterium]|nr:cell wall-active antibiotics response protein [Acidimicrobiia bacterium]MDH4306055.1 cell wall-active antibiotics response protein [Acidimicrobiia bacterium]
MKFKVTALIAAAVSGSLAAAALIAKKTLPVVDDPAADEIALVSIFDGTALRPTSTRFRGGTVLSMFGGTVLDLRRAGLPPGGAQLTVTSLFGGTEIVVPDTWIVEVSGPAIFGGVSRSTPEPHLLPADNPRLTVRSRAAFGGTAVAARPVLRTAEAPA